MSDYRRIRFRRSPSSEWIGTNPVLAIGEAGYETDSRQLKVGDGVTAWNNLDYLAIPPSSINHPEILFSITDTEDPKIILNLSDNEMLAVIGSGDTSLIYDNDNKKLVVYTQSGSGILTYGNIVSKLGYVPQVSGNYSLSNHTHSISEINNLAESLSGKQPSGNYSLVNHTHNLSIGDGNTTKINYISSGVLNIVGSGYTNIGYDNASNTVTIGSIGNSGVLSFNNRSGTINLSFVDVTGALSYVPQPVGNYSISGHTHSTSDILDLNSFLLKLPYKTPAGPYVSGVQGEVCYDDNYLYICIYNGLWRRIGHSIW